MLGTTIGLPCTSRAARRRASGEGFQITREDPCPWACVIAQVLEDGIGETRMAARAPVEMRERGSVPGFDRFPNRSRAPRDGCRKVMVSAQYTDTVQLLREKPGKDGE